MTDLITDRNRLQSDIELLQRETTQQRLLSPVEDAGNHLREASQKIQSFRQRGYVFARDLDNQIATLLQGWTRLEAEALDLAQNRARKLGWELQDLQDLCNRLNTSDPSAQTQINRGNSEIIRIRSELRDAEQQIKISMGQVPNQVKAIGEVISRIQSTFDHLQGASFPLKNGEMIYLAAKAGWKKAEKETIEGVLYLTDQRLIMEQDQKKGSFMGLGGNRVRQFCWEAPYNLLQEVRSEKKGLLGRIDLLHLRFSSGGPAPETTIEVKEGLQADWFAGQVQRVQRGDLEAERLRPANEGQGAVRQP